MRLDRFMSHAIGVSRAEARREIRKGRVMLDGQAVRDPASHVQDKVQVTWRGEELTLPGARYLMLHKPPGLVCATRDPAQATVLSLLPPAMPADLHIVGRLDRDTTGLLLLTTDGGWTHRIISPRTDCLKVYRARLVKRPDEAALALLREGLLLRGETRPTRPAEVVQCGEHEVRIGIREGRYHQVRRMFAAVGNRVLDLHRESIGGLVLDPALNPGEWRELRPGEVEQVFE